MDLQQVQLKALTEMLQLSMDDMDDSNILNTRIWKILIYDNESKNLLSPILKVGDLRRLGVTINMSLNESREPVPGVDAVYLITPTDENLDIILQDAKESKYNRIHINFTTFTSDDYLSKLAKRFVEYNAFNAVASVTDRYIHFISLSHNMFSLNMPNSFRIFYGDETEEEASVHLDALVDRLMSVVVTLNVLPLIRSSIRVSPASTVAERLSSKLHHLINARHQLGISLSTSYNRPMLVILDRNVDLSPMIQHSWNYQPLLHDVFGIHYNKVTLDCGKKVSYDLESSDKIYQSIIRMPLSDVAMHIASSLEQYNNQIAQINMVTAAGTDATSTGSLVTAMNAIPKLTEQKRLLDLHTNLATALVDAVKQREIDRFYEFEHDLNYQSDKNCLLNFEDLLSMDGHAMDKYRSLLLLALAKPNIPEIKIDEYEAAIKVNGDLGNCTALQGLRSVLRMRAFSENLLNNVQMTNYNEEDMKGDIAAAALNVKPQATQGHKRLAQYSSKILDTGFSIFKGVRNLLPKKKDTYLVNLLENLIDNAPSIADEFLIYDPKLAANASSGGNKKITSKNCIIFIVGGGSYNEAFAMQDFAAKVKQNIIYGSTFFDRPEDFVLQLGSFEHNI